MHSSFSGGKNVVPKKGEKVPYHKFSKMFCGTLEFLKGNKFLDL